MPQQQGDPGREQRDAADEQGDVEEFQAIEAGAETEHQRGQRQRLGPLASFPGRDGAREGQGREQGGD